MTRLVHSRLQAVDGGLRLIAQLQSFNIRHVEQLASLLLSPTGRIAIEMGLDDVDIGAIESAISAQLNTIAIPGLQIRDGLTSSGDRPRNRWERRGYGLKKQDYEENYDIFSKISDTVKIEDDSSHVGDFVNFLDGTLAEEALCSKFHSLFSLGSFPSPKDQGARGTCVAFAVNTMLSTFIDLRAKNFPGCTDLSEQYLYFRAKHLDPSDDEGTTIEYAMQALKEYGVCPDSHLKYKNYVDWGHKLLFETNWFDLPQLTAAAKKVNVSNYLHVPYLDIVENTRKCLLRGYAVVIGVLVFKEAWGNDFSIWQGEIELPIVREETDGSTTLLDVCQGGHAICVVGFQDNDDEESPRPGGGAFLFRNSWGTDWAAKNEFGRGYGLIPYEYVRKYCVEACVLTDAGLLGSGTATKQGA